MCSTARQKGSASEVEVLSLARAVSTFTRLSAPNACRALCFPALARRSWLCRRGSHRRLDVLGRVHLGCRHRGALSTPLAVQGAGCPDSCQDTGKLLDRGGCKEGCGPAAATPAQTGARGSEPTAAAPPPPATRAAPGKRQPGRTTPRQMPSLLRWARSHRNRVHPDGPHSSLPRASPLQSWIGWTAPPAVTTATHPWQARTA